MNKPYAEKMYQNYLQSNGDIDAIECEFDCEVRFNTYVYKGEDVFVSEIDLHGNFILINSCDESPLSGVGNESKELTVEEFINGCLN